MWTPLILAALQSVSVSVSVETAPDTLRLRPDSAAMATAYQDHAARELVRLARASRGDTEAALFRYQATMRQRLSVGLRAFRWDRLLYRRETAAHVDWRRDAPTRVEILGAREAIPVVQSGVQIPDDLDRWGRDMVHAPGDDRLPIAPQGNGFAWHPLVEGGEAVYQYAVGDSTTVRLPDGREIRLVELRVSPREPDIRLVTGSFWVERDGHAIVQAVYRPSREFDLERDLPRIDPDDAEDVDDVPGFLKPIRFDLRYVTVEYGLWDMQWWLPRLIAVDGSLQMGRAVFPATFETRYEDYRVEGDRYGLPELPPLIRDLAGYDRDTPTPYRPGTRVVVSDSGALLESRHLPGSIFDEDRLISDQELSELASRLGDLPAVPVVVERPRFAWPWELRPGLVRYNRVEGLSVGARMDWDLARAALDATARLGTADMEPRAELGIEVSGPWRTWRAAGYHRLATAGAGSRALDLGNSLNALLFGRDDGLYYRTSGAELMVAAAPGERPYQVRLFAERQASADRNTTFNLRDAISGDAPFRENIRAERAVQLGLAGGYGLEWGQDPDGFRFRGYLDARAETGDFTFLRPGITAAVNVPLPFGLLASTEVGAGTIVGSGSGDAVAPLQSHWYLGGPSTVRGFPGGYLGGEEYGRARVELARGSPAVRLALFSDAGWAGPRSGFDADDALLSAGVGASFLNGFVRLDLARTIQPVEHWRLELYVDALF